MYKFVINSLEKKKIKKVRIYRIYIGTEKQSHLRWILCENESKFLYSIKSALFFAKIEISLVTKENP